MSLNFVPSWWLGAPTDPTHRFLGYETRPSRPSLMSSRISTCRPNSSIRRGQTPRAETGVQIDPETPLPTWDSNVLGDYCHGLRSNEACGSLFPPLTLVLSYKRAMHKHGNKHYKQTAMRVVQSWKDVVTKIHEGEALHNALTLKRPEPWLDQQDGERPGQQRSGQG